jgi:hypothetical protein
MNMQRSDMRADMQRAWDTHQRIMEEMAGAFTRSQQAVADAVSKMADSVSELSKQVAVNNTVVSKCPGQEVAQIKVRT